MRNSTVLWIILAVLMIGDGMISTPYALTYTNGAYESNPTHSAQYEKYGVIYFYVTTPALIIFMYFVFYGMERRFEHIENGELPLTLVALTMISLFIYTNVNNFSIILAN